MVALKGGISFVNLDAVSSTCLNIRFCCLGATASYVPRATLTEAIFLVYLC